MSDQSHPPSHTNPGSPHSLPPVQHPHLPSHKPEHAEEGEGNWLVSYADMMTLLVGFFVILMSFSTIDQEKFEELKRIAAKQFGGTYEAPYEDVAKRIRGELEKLNISNQFSIKQTELGVEISFLGTVFFETGSADIRKEGRELLEKLAPVVKAESGQFNILVEGHTDDVPVSAGLAFKTNWELSSIRACRVLEAFQRVGFEKGILTAVGYGEARPLVPNRDPAGNAIPENQSRNRRVLIKLLKRPSSTMTGEAGGAAEEAAAASH